jgi:hypothetical protein
MLALLLLVLAIHAPRPVTVTVVNAFPFNVTYATALQFCGNRGLKPSNVELGREGTTSLPASINRLSGDVSSCFHGPAKTVVVAFNEDDWLVNCRASIAPIRGGYRFWLSESGPFADCSVVTTSRYTATFKFQIRR